MESRKQSEIAVYIATHKDAIPRHKAFEIPIQVGSGHEGEPICPVRDNTGENISGKNPSFCELTALYWIWKQDTHAIQGLSHYRRRFCADESEIEKKLARYDLLTPPPYYFRVTLREEYERYHRKEDLDTLLKVCRETVPESIGSLEYVLEQNRIFPYNMMIAPRETISAYCEWLFPILFEMEARLDLTGRTAYQKRVFGFLSERLFTAYIRQKRLNCGVCRVRVPEMDTLWGNAKFHAGIPFNRLYFRRHAQKKIQAQK